MSDSLSYRHRRIRWGDFDYAVRAAVAEFDLYNLGWQRFHALDWVRELDERYQIIDLSYAVSSYLGFRLDEARRLFEQADVDDRQGILNFFAGKQALEELSCRRSGAGAGACDKRCGYSEIVRLYEQLLAKEESHE
jgi:hypothetical protein